jgi:hypothetical protein
MHHGQAQTIGYGCDNLDGRCIVPREFNRLIWIDASIDQDGLIRAAAETAHRLPQRHAHPMHVDAKLCSAVCRRAARRGLLGNGGCWGSSERGRGRRENRGQDEKPPFAEKLVD